MILITPLLMTFTSVFDTGLHADCTSFVPNLQKSNEEIAVFSCYEFNEATNRRLGKLLLVKQEENRVNVLDEITDIPGVFEFTWFPNTNILVTALAKGAPKLFKYEVEENKLSTINTSCDQDDNLEFTLAVAGDPDCFLTCDNKGYLTKWSMNTDNLEIVSKWNAHDAEIWYVSQDLHDKNIFYTGSDNASMKIWDVRTESQVAINKFTHESGVCCIKSSPFDEFVIASGSYDENIRLWDRRMIRSPTLSIGCGNGVWRVSWNPRDKNLIAVASMRAGFHVVDLLNEQLHQTESVEDHVAYGIDWHPNGITLASCSFYNNQGQFFSIKNKIFNN